jgi:hypothetical protein
MPHTCRLSGTVVNRVTFAEMRIAAVAAWRQGTTAAGIWEILEERFPEESRATRELLVGIASQDIRIPRYPGWNVGPIQLGNLLTKVG